MAQEQDVPVLEELYLEFSNWVLARNEAIRKAIKDPNSELLITELNGQLVGFLHQIFFHDILHAGLHSYIAGLFVKEEHRRKGIASELIQRALERAKRRKVVEVHVDTKECNEIAIKLYAKHGFKRVGVMFECYPK